jgi:integrase
VSKRSNSEAGKKSKRVRANGEGAIYKRPDGRWTARVTLPGGRRKDYYGKSREDVNRKLTAALKDQQGGLPIVGERQTVEQYLVSWLGIIRPTVRPRTYKGYREYVRLHAVPQMGKLILSRLQPQHVQGLYANRLEAGLSAQSVRHLHSVLHKAMKDACVWGHTPRNVVDLVKPPRAPRHEMKTLSPDQVRTFLEVVRGNRLEALYVLALSTGMRQGELLALRWSGVELNAGTIQVVGTLQRIKSEAGPSGLAIAEPKTSRSRRQVALSFAAVEALKRHEVRQNAEKLFLGSAWEDNGLVFPNEIGKPIEATNLLRRSFNRF